MSRPLKLEFVRSRLPVCYRYNPFVYWLLILMSFSIMVYSIYFMIRFVNTGTPIFFKILPIAIAFVGLDSVLKKITSLYSVTFEQDHIRLSYIAKKALVIPYQDILELDIYRKITFYFGFTYSDAQGKPRKYVSQASFPHTMEILLNLADMAPQATIPAKMQDMVDYLKESASNGV